MRKVYLRSKNLVLKGILTFLGFTLAASQCLAQYMAFYPTVTLKGKLKGVTDTISKFMVVINQKDTLYTSAQEDYKFLYGDGFDYSPKKKYIIEVHEQEENRNYFSSTKIVAVKPEDWNKEIEVDIKMQKKN